MSSFFWRFRDLPIRRKISLIVVVGMASAMIVSVANFISFDRENVKRDLSEELRVLARITAARSAAAVAFGDRSNALENLSALSLRSTVQYACIYDQEQLLFARFQRKDSVFDSCPDVLDYQDAHFKSGRKDLLEIVEPIFRKGQRLGYVLVASDMSPIAERTRKWIVTSFFVTFAALIVAFFMTRRLLRGVLQPITDLANVMDDVRHTNDLGLRAASVEGRDETGRLVDSFNEMLQIVEANNRDLERLYRGLVEKSAEVEATAASLELRNQQIKDLFGSAAHDLRQPLQAMSIFVQALERKIQDADQLAVVDKLRQAIQNLSSLFKEILDVSRYEFDLHAAEVRPYSIRHLVSKVALEFEAIAQEKGLKLRFFTSDDRVLAHGALLERIIRNLLSNAIRYTDQGGVLLGCRRRGKHLMIEVWDTGRGIPQHQQTEIFGKFVQVSEEDREQRGGFGLGLAIVKQFVDSLGYSLTVHSREGRGTLFRLMVPLVDEPTRRARVVEPRKLMMEEEPSTGSLLSLQDHEESRILLIDDTDSIRDGLKMTLIEWGFVVDDFADIASMEAFYRQGGPAPALIISDFQLGPEDTGDLAIEVARQCLQKDVPAFIVTGAEDEAVWERIRASGLTALRKPVKPARLRALINHLLQ